MSAYDYADTYDRLGFEVPGLGCVMLDVTLPKAAFLPDLHWYTSTVPGRGYISGQQSGTAHVTLLYGLLTLLWKRAYRDSDDIERWYQDDIARVMDGWQQPTSILLGKVSTFPSTFEGEDYVCVVAHVYHPALTDAHQRLSLLPHIDTFPTYQPHVTLGYVKNDADTAHAILQLREAYENRIVEVRGLNYGKFR